MSKYTEYLNEIIIRKSSWNSFNHKDRISHTEIKDYIQSIGFIRGSGSPVDEYYNHPTNNLAQINVIMTTNNYADHFQVKMKVLYGKNIPIKTYKGISKSQFEKLKKIIDDFYLNNKSIN